MITQQFTYEDARIMVLLAEQPIGELINSLSNFEDYKTEFLKITNEKRQREFLGVRIAMNILTGKNVIINYDENQKPFLSDASWKISVSHSCGYIAVITHPEAEVGIDIEGRTAKVSKVYKRFLNEEEQAYFVHDEDTGLLEIAWSAKEALYKIIGKTALDFARQLHLYPFISEESGSIKAAQTTDFKLFTLQYIQNDKFTMVYCIDKN
ncbi:MAG: 4'-phosphopantetheinyl transferase superfamily protein [Paludibacter sp.]|nr:4'-phosphopantetheinyl transferase superfamily protein [Paludibacter sp.]